MLYPFQLPILQFRNRGHYVLKVPLSCLGSLVLASVATAQSIGSQQVITTSADYAISVYATDLDGDGDTDVLSASRYDDKIAWYENQGTGDAVQQVITTNADGANSVYATDLDGDGDPDVLSASYQDDKIAWYENQGGASLATSR